MGRNALLHLLLTIFFIPLAHAQNADVTVIKSRIEIRADSVARIIDSLISLQKFSHLVIDVQNNDDTTKYYRHYYLDTVNLLLLKCVIDTTFEDYYKRSFKQVVIYFNQGYEFKKCYNLAYGITDSLCDYFTILPEQNEVKQKLGELDKNWTKSLVDEMMRTYVDREIGFMKWAQKRYSNSQ